MVKQPRVGSAKPSYKVRNGTKLIPRELVSDFFF